MEKDTVVQDELSQAKPAESKLVRRAGIVGLGTLLSRVLGLGRDLVLAAVFPRAATDLFFVAFTIPNALRQLLAEGAVSSAFVPVLARVQARDGKSAAEAFYARMRGTLTVVLLVTCVAGVLAAPLLCELFASGFHKRPGAFETTVRLTRWLFPYLLFMGLAALAAGALNTRGKFAASAFAPALLNLAMIAAALGLAPLLFAQGIDPLMALAAGALVGGLLQVLAQVRSLRSAGFIGRMRFGWGDPDVREVVRRMGPMALGLMIYEVDLVLSRRFLSDCGEGANSYFYYAQRLCDFPQGVFALALATASLPSLAKLAAESRREELARGVEHALCLSAYVALPATVMLAVLARPIVTLAFARGAFDQTSIDGTTAALWVQALGVILVATVRQIVPVFHALGDTRTPVWISGLDLLAFIGLAFALRGPLGHVGVSWAVTGSSAIQMFLLAQALIRKVPEFRALRVIGSALRTLGACALGALVAIFVLRLRLPIRLQAIAALVGFVVAFFVGAGVLKQPEQQEILGGVLRRMRRR